MNDRRVSSPRGQHDVGYFGVPPMLHVSFGLKSPKPVVWWMNSHAGTLLFVIAEWKERRIEGSMDGAVLVNSTVN